MKRQVLVLLLLAVLVGNGAIAQDFWQGSALVAPYGRFPNDGAYVASNSFPTNTVVQITNLETGKTTRAVVVGRADTPGVFMVLSSEAAEAVGASSEEPFQVRVSRTGQTDPAAAARGQDLPFHPDPDINPAASVADPNAFVTQAEPEDGDAEAAEDQAAQSTEDQAAEAEVAQTEEAAEPDEQAAQAEADEQVAQAEADEQVAQAEADEEAAEDEAAEPPRDVADRERDGLETGLAGAVERLTGRFAEREIAEGETAPATEAESADAEPGAGAAAAEPASPQLRQAESPGIAPPQPAQESPRMAEAPQPRIKEQGRAEAEADGAPSGPRITTETQLRSRPSVGRLSGTSGVASGATRLAGETEHTDRLGGPAESDSVLTFRRSPLPDEPDAGRLASEEGEASGARAAEADTGAAEEPQISDLGPMGAPAERIDGAPVSTPSLQSPVAESLGMRPGAENETVRISRSLPSAQPAEDRTGEEADREQTEAADEPSPVIEEVETPRTEERVTDQELPIAEQEEPGTAMEERPLPGDAIVELEPGEYRPPEYRGPEESTASPDGAEGEAPAVSDMSRLASPADGAADEATEEEGPAPPSRRPPEEQPEEEPEEQPAADEEPKAAEAQAAAEDGQDASDEQQRVASREPSEAATALEGLTMIRELDGASYYLQVGAYTDIESARRMVRAMEETYPMAVNPVSREDGTLYRVLVGPLSDDEKGATLYRVRARGHRDAFVRAGSTVGSAGSS
jgi:hypothetical protein